LRFNNLPFLDGFIDTLKKVRYKKPRPVLCPRCGGHNMISLQNYGILPRIYRCEECGYEGNLVIELEKIEETDEETREDDDF
jgi:predicted RNA-binding Zn-ribbon protein involved in translation (DUF1610 family)